MIKLQSIEPFLTYPESIIDSEEKSLKVIKQNYYYFIVMGCFLVTLGCIIFIGESQNREMIISGISNILIGSIYISLSYIAKRFKSRFAAMFLGGFIVFMFIGDLILIGTDAIDYLFPFKVTLAVAAYRIMKAATYYNKMKL